VLRNPLAAKELRGRMRGPRPFAIVTVYLVLLGLVALGVYAIIVDSSESTRGSSVPLGKLFFVAISALELGLICGLTPLFTADLISGERERRTYDLLLVTPLSRGQIVVGKLVAGIGSLLLLIVLGLPLQAVGIVLGGVGAEELAVTFALLLLTALTYGCAGLFWSARVRSTRAAVALAYGTTALGILGLPVALFLGVLAAQLVGSSPAAFPFRLIDGREVLESQQLAQIVAAIGQLLLATNPLLTGVFSAYALSEGHGLLFEESLGRQDVVFIAPWLLFALVHVIATAFLIALTGRAVGPRAPRG
jgi:ABC-type transport system involved in multi-copper enzyme maturation permease subunit